MAVTAGGTSLCIWDMLAGGRLLKRLANFQKTVTSVTASDDRQPETFLLYLSVVQRRPLLHSMVTEKNCCAASVRAANNLACCCAASWLFK